MDNRGRYTGPDGKPKAYVGADPAKIAEARRLAANRQEWERLDEAARRLQEWERRATYTLENLARHVHTWPRFPRDHRFPSQPNESVYI